MSTLVSSNPFPLGLITPGASFSTVSLPITTNVADLATAGSPYSAVDSIYVHALAGNLTDSIYLLNSAAAPDTVAYSNVVDVIASGSSTSIASAGMNTLNLSQFYIGASSATAAALVTVKYR